MSHKIDEYKKNRIYDLELPSGLNVKVKDVTPYTFLKVQKELNILPTAEHFYSLDLIEKLFEAFFIEPKIPDEMALDDFSREDYLFLHDLIFEKILRTEEKLQADQKVD